MKENRRYTRMVLEGKVTLKPEGDPAGAITADLVNVSYGGMCVNSAKALEAGAAVQFELKAGWSGTSLCGKGRISSVVETKRYSATYFRIGIDFVDVNQSEVLTIINSRTQRRPPPSGQVPGTFDFPA